MRRLAFILILLLAGCTRTIYVPEHHTEYIVQETRDSIYMTDSVFVRETVQGDTVFRDRDRWHTEYRDRWRTDTIIRVDSIPTPVEVTRIEYRTPAPVRWLAWVGAVAIAAAVLALIRRKGRQL